LEKKSVLIDGHQVWYRERGKGNLTILVLSGWGELNNDAYFALQDKLAEIGYRVILPDFPGFGDSPANFIPPEKWADWVEKFVEASGGKDFIMISHSGGGWIAFQYLKEEHPLCRGAILLNPGLMLPWQSRFWRIIRKLLRIFLPFVLPGMRWVKDSDTWLTAQAFLIPPPQDTKIKVPCTIFLGRKDPFRFLIGGWRRISDCDVQKFNWDHSPQMRAVGELTNTINNTIRRRFKA